VNISIPLCWPAHKKAGKLCRQTRQSHFLSLLSYEKANYPISANSPGLDTARRNLAIAWFMSQS